LRVGTDGVRGRVDVELNDSLVARLGAAVGREFPGRTIVIGHDGRESGPRLAAAFARGAISQGCSVSDGGLVPTPAIARAASARDCVGVAITASHNPWNDNGVKVFAPGGRKLLDSQQMSIESHWQSSGDPSRGSSSRSDPSRGEARSAAVRPDSSIGDDYVRAIATELSVADFAGREVVLDCANGATSRVAPAIARAVGLSAVVRNAEPDGRNINDGCGAVHPAAISAECARRGVVGVAFDGDGDRVIAVDETGTVVDGDRLIALAALDLRDRSLLAHDTVVVTSMTNLGFHRAMRERGVRVVATDVGDRAVLAAMQDGGYVLGGEQSGHIIHAAHATTGDGILSAMLLLDLVRRRGERLADLAGAVMQRLPQVLHNVRVTHKPADIEALLADELARERAALGDDGRIVVRASGTEPLVRIMVEATTLELAKAVVARLERLVVARA
jgi:phosphoglucosamine mutase